MPKRITSFDRKDSIIFVLWGTRFEEAAATIFTTKLRQVGLCVQLVSLAGQRPVGQNGLALYPDLPLGDALRIAKKAVCVILPCSAETFRQMECDPRLSEFFHQANANDARFIVSTMDSIQKTGLKKLVIANELLSTYQNVPNLMQFADELASSLANVYGV
ncbi:MAG: hypothetical protein AAF702_45015 [Chloroflexota bacterium]